MVFPERGVPIEIHHTPQQIKWCERDVHESTVKYLLEWHFTLELDQLAGEAQGCHTD